MENLAPPYQFVLILIQDMESGIAARISAKNYVRSACGEFAGQIAAWLMTEEQGSGRSLFQKQKAEMNAFRRALFDLLQLSLQGVSILDSLRDLEQEMRKVSEQQLESHLAKLPFKLMLPVLFLQFPALLILILGPLLVHLTKEI